MGTLETNSRQIKTVRNPKVHLSDAEEAAFRRIRERHFTQMDKEESMLRKARPTENIRGLKKATDAMLREAIPDFESRRQQILERFTPGFNKTRPDVLPLHRLDLDLDYDGPGELHPVFPEPNPKVPPPRFPEGACEFWWAQTTLFSSFPEITVDIPDDFVHIFGHLHYEGDDRLIGSVGYIEEYGLGPDRFPMLVATSLTPVTPDVMFEVRTDLRISGVLSGFTGFYHWLWGADDKWCKCRQVTRQRAFLSTGEQLDVRTLSLPMISLENSHPVGQANPVLTGGFLERLFLPVNLGALFNVGTSILVQIETRYEIELEGDADIWFRHIGGSAQQSVPSVENAVLCQSQPMCLRAART